MLEVGWTEMLVIAIVMIVVVGPKDLPNMLRSFGRMTAKLRAMANDFRRQFDEAMKEAELDEVKKSVDSLRSLNPATEVRKQLNPFEKAAGDLRAGVEQAMKPKTAASPSSEGSDKAAVPTEGAKSTEGAKKTTAETPDAAGPEAMPPEPVFPAMTEASAAPTAVEGPATGPAKPKKASAARSGTAAPKAAARPARKSAAAKTAGTKTAGTKAATRKAAPAKPAASKKTARTK